MQTQAHQLCVKLFSKIFEHQIKNHFTHRYLMYEIKGNN
jgi:hypothetical protein